MFFFKILIFGNFIKTSAQNMSKLTIKRHRDVEQIKLTQLYDKKW